MSKRKLSKAQTARIAKKQQAELLTDSGQQSESGEAHSRCNGRIVSHYGQQLDVEILSADRKGEVIRCHQRANLPALVTGDLVVWKEEDSETGVILALGERKSLFGRPTASSDFKAVAANIDYVLVVIAPLPEPFLNLIDRYLVAIENLNLEPLIVLNKNDLLKEVAAHDLDNMLTIYKDIGYRIFSVSATTGDGIADLEAALVGKTTVLVGQSGVGKSSLINRFGLDDIALVGALSATRDKGTHTTTTAKLFHLPHCDLVDSPGIREFSLGQISQHQLFLGYREFREIEEQCKFRDCSHRSEPDCAIQRAADAGEIHPRRLESYFQTLQSLENPPR